MGITAAQLLALQQTLTEQKAAVLTTIVQVKGSAPRGPGTAMIVTENSLVGTVGGGRLEFEAMGFARRMIANKNKTLSRERYPLGDRLGQCCGGSVELLFEPVEPGWITWVTDALSALEKRLPYNRKSACGYTHCISPPDAHLVLCGAGHVGCALVHVLANAPISIHWVDERSKQFPATVPANVVCEVTDLAEVVIETAPANCAVLVTTHRHDLDFTLTEAALARNDIIYCGMIGSLSKRARFERLWLQRGHEKDRLGRLICPIGHSGPAGKEPEIVAIAVAAEVLSTLQTAVYS